jgi:hypothetical protein
MPTPGAMPTLAVGMLPDSTTADIAKTDSVVQNIVFLVFPTPLPPVKKCPPNPDLPKSYPN